ncbi:unnamed protein product, partial [Polarella glacialis]
LLAFAGLLAVALRSSEAFASSRGNVAGARLPRFLAPQRRLQVAVFGSDTFDPWTVLGISTQADKEEARKAYKKLIAKYHPDVDPSPAAEVMFQKIVRAHAVVTGEDKVLDTRTLLKNAAENLRNELPIKKLQVERLKAEAAQAEQDFNDMEVDLKTAEANQKKVTNELGAFGGGLIGVIVGGPAGLVLGAVLGLALGAQDNAIGQVIRGTGTVVKGAADAVGKVVNK